MTRRESFVTRWDLDKTYLRSRFDTLGELVSAALEPARNKRAIPGATALLRELWSAGARVHILSGSPRQMRKKLETKFRLDGVLWDELTLKPNLSNAVLLRLKALRDQLGYKLPELLSARARDQLRFVAPDAAREILVGDDSEADAFIYSLYADLCVGNISENQLERVFWAGRTDQRAFLASKQALSSIQTGPVVDRILIHLDGQTPPSHFARYGERLVPFYNYLQAAFVLLERGFLSAVATLRVTCEFLEFHGFSWETVARSYADLLRRGHADGQAPDLLKSAPFGPHGKLETTAAEIKSALAQMAREVPRSEGGAGTPTIDYIELAGQHRGGRNRRRPGQRFW